MAKETFYNLSFASPVQVTREEYINVGSGDNTLGDYPRAIKGSTDFEIWDAASGGNQLTEGVDYELRNRDKVLSPKAGFDVYAGYRILNATYQTGSIFITYKIIRSYNDAEIQNDVRLDIDQNASDIASILANPALPFGYITGLEISNNSIDSDHDIDIAVGRCKDDTDTIDLILSSTFIKQIDAAWSVGTNAGGLDTGVVAADTFYYFFLIEKDSDNSIDVLISASPTSPTMPAGYTKKRRIRGAVLTDGSANILGFNQKDDYFWYNSRIEDVSNLTPGTLRNIAITSIAPNFIGIFRLYIQENTLCKVSYGNLNEIDVAPGDSTSDLIVAGVSEHGSIIKNILTDSSSQIFYRSTVGTVTKLKIVAQGFIDNAEI